MRYPIEYDVIVIGGGHAGTEACLASSRMGAKTLLLTHNVETLGQMSCNPAIGGIGKSHLVAEIDAMGGIMAEAIDAACIQGRILNKSKGPAVWATRMQADRNVYKQYVREAIEDAANLDLIQQGVDDLIIEADRVLGVITNLGIEFRAQQVVLTAGTFLAGRIHVGEKNQAGGRAGDMPAQALAVRLKQYGLPQGRLKTGTPPRLDSKTIDFSKLEVQPGDVPRPQFSFWGRAVNNIPQLPCHITYTNKITHAIIQKNIQRSAWSSGNMSGIGVRYCPSIEDKIEKFAAKESHQIYLEPEGISSCEVYPNGLSTSLPFDVQMAIVHSMKGLERAHIVRPGYAIEYDYFDPQSLEHTLESKKIAGLFLAGQINGTTGYEEAAAQGLLAGINAACKAAGKSTWFPARSEAYLGVMVDDLVSSGTIEPYRMFTSRAEYRLQLREDTAVFRLSEKAQELGLLPREKWQKVAVYKEKINKVRAQLETTTISPEKHGEVMLAAGIEVRRATTVAAMLARPKVSYAMLPQKLLGLPKLRVKEEKQVENFIKYAGYVARQEQEAIQLQRLDKIKIPATINYKAISGLSTELIELLSKVGPKTLKEAQQLPGMTPAACALLRIYLQKKRAVLHAVTSDED